MIGKLISDIINNLNKDGIDLERFYEKNILVTGGAGFIGSWLVQALVLMGAKVSVVDNLWRGSLNNLKGGTDNYLIPLNERFLLGDLREYHTALSACVKFKPDIVYHLADIVAGVDYVFANEPFVFRSNCLINSNLFKAVQETDVSNVIYLGTACSYPKKLQLHPGGEPLLEEQVFPADPESGYGWSKLLGEYEVELYSKYHNVNVGILRLHNVYGPRSILAVKRSQVIPSLIRKAIRYPKEDFIVWGSGNQARDFIFVGDVLDALIRLPLKGMGLGPIQISSAQETSVAELASLIVEISGKKIDILFDQTKPEGDGGRSGNIDKARRVLGWENTTTLTNGLKLTYEWAYEEIVNRTVELDT